MFYTKDCYPMVCCPDIDERALEYDSEQSLAKLTVGVQVHRVCLKDNDGKFLGVIASKTKLEEMGESPDCWVLSDVKRNSPDTGDVDHHYFFLTFQCKKPRPKLSYEELFGKGYLLLCLTLPPDSEEAFFAFQISWSLASHRFVFKEIDSPEQQGNGTKGAKDSYAI